MIADTSLEREKRIVTCSGAYKGGSLRVVRSGVGFNEGADLELEGIRNVWSVWNGFVFSLSHFLLI